MRLPSPRHLTLATLALAITSVASLSSIAAAAPSQDRPHILIVTVDDMSADSIGVFGCPLDTTPTIDNFARQSLRFNLAHVQVGNCMPGRNLMWSGLFSHVNGVEGFVQNRQAKYPVLCDLAKAAGYFAAIRGKVAHSTPYAPYAWDAVLDHSDNGKPFHIKDPQSYGAATRKGIQLAKQAGKPFCLMVNISDPHKPFYSQTRNGQPDPYVPSRVFEAANMPVPKFLPKDEVVQQELALYYSSVRRADDCFAEIMKALDDSGEANETFVMFLSDHGMPLPFAKTQLYHHSTHTPLMVRWPSVTKPNTVDDHHMVSAIDFLPTLLEVMQHEHPAPDTLHGRSFAPLLHGESQDGRDYVILQYNENAGRNRHPMRGIQTKEHLYLYNPWSDGKRKFATATTGTMTYRQMVKRAKTEPEVARRLDLFDHRVLHELYDVANDPNCLHNLIDDSVKQPVIRELRGKLAKVLAEMNDPVAPLLADPTNTDLRTAYMEKEDARTAAARKNRKNKQAKGKQGKSKQGKAKQGKAKGKTTASAQQHNKQQGNRGKQTRPQPA